METEIDGIIPMNNIDQKNALNGQSIISDTNKTVCLVCSSTFPNPKVKSTSQICQYCRGTYYYYSNKKKFDQNEFICVSNQDCVITNKEKGCLKCRIAKTKAIIPSNGKKFKDFRISILFIIYLFL